MSVIYKSNGGRVGDGARVTRVSNSGQTFAVMVDEKTERFSEVILSGVTITTPLVHLVSSQTELNNALASAADGDEIHITAPGRFSAVDDGSNSRRVTIRANAQIDITLDVQ